MIFRSANAIENWQETTATLEALFEGDVDWTLREHDNEKLHLVVTECRFADFFRGFGEFELGS